VCSVREAVRGGNAVSADERKSSDPVRVRSAGESEKERIRAGKSKPRVQRGKCTNPGEKSRETQAEWCRQKKRKENSSERNSSEKERVCALTERVNQAER